MYMSKAKWFEDLLEAVVPLEDTEFAVLFLPRAVYTPARSRSYRLTVRLAGQFDPEPMGL